MTRKKPNKNTRARRRALKSKKAEIQGDENTVSIKLHPSGLPVTPEYKVESPRVETKKSKDFVAYLERKYRELFGVNSDSDE